MSSLAFIVSFHRAIIVAVDPSLISMRLKKDPESDAMDPELEADILRIIPHKVSGAYVKPAHCESKGIS